MNQEQVPASAIEIFKKHYTSWYASQQGQTSGYEYEKSYVDMMSEVGQEVLRASLGEVPKDKNRKKNFKPVMEK